MAFTVLSAGAAQAVVTAAIPRFEAAHGLRVAASFGAVGFLRDRLQAGEPCDVIILSQSLIEELQTTGVLVPGSARPLGSVATGIAVCSGCPAVAVADGEELRAAFAAAEDIFVPDLGKSTAGRHFAAVLEKLGLTGEVAPRVRAFPNGATAMAELAASAGDGLLGCTQVTEILQTPGVSFVAELPHGFALSTVYTAAVAANSTNPDLATAFVAALSGEDSATIRKNAGFRE